MVAISLSFVVAFVLLIFMAIGTAILGGYLLLTNPPKDESTFIGVGAEKVSNDEYS